MRSSFIPWVLSIGAAQCFAAATPARGSTEFFETKIRPVLVEKCYSCHSEGAKKLKGNFKLDTAAGLLRGGDSGNPAVVPGHPEKSKLLEAIEYENDDLQMPPKEKLPAETLANFRAWVEMGAPDPRTSVAAATPSHLDIEAAKKNWWSFRKPQPQQPPAVKNIAWVKTPIDQFILARLEAKGLAPSHPADKRTLIRRATFDLIGLPPTPEEIEAFEEDPSPNAFETVVDRLLASPHYGERWGRYWLDVARYADTKGYVFEEERKYPFAYTFRDWVVRAFNEDMPYDQFLTDQIAADKVVHGPDNRDLAAMGFLTVGRRFLNNQADIIDDRIDVVCRGMLAMTVGCARCHDHKFDPIPTKDYYSLYGIFASSTEPTEGPDIGTGPKSAATAAFEKKLAALKDDLAKFRAAKFKEISADVSTPKAIADYLVAARGVRETRPEDADKFKAALIKFNVRRGVLIGWRTYLAAVKPGDPFWSSWNKLSKLDDNAIALKAGEIAKATSDATLRDALLARQPKTLRELAETYAAIIAKNPTNYSPLALKEASVETYFNRADKAGFQQKNKAIATLLATDPASPAKAMVVVDLPQPVQPHVFKRGNPANVGDAVPRAFLSVLSPSPRPEFKTGSGRLDLAKAITSKDNPVTARVIVNRIWGHHFGQAIVRTPSDFGRRGELPSHPRLLDYLALQLENNGWSLKKLQKEIMLSAVYQQSSDDEPANRAVDPENTLLWRFNRQRLDFEATRDSLLAVSGQIDLSIGGRPVDIVAAPFSHRRTIYGFVDRQNLPNLFREFDFASPDSTSPQRFHTTVPQQALFMMNSPFAIDAAKALVKRPDVADESEPQKKIERLYEVIFDRSPTADEMKVGMQFVSGADSNPTMSPWDRYAQVLMETNEFAFVD